MSKKILLVEDNEDNSDALSELFELDSKFVIVKASSGEEALQLVSVETFCIILMDIGLPGMDGYETTRKIKAMGVLTPIVGLTAHALNSNKKLASLVGMVAYETKPFKFKHLLSIINEILGESNGTL